MLELENKTMGIIGLGRIGKHTAKIAAALGMRVIAYDSVRTELKTAEFSYTDIDTLLTESDVIALHCPLTPTTENIINREAIMKMKTGAILINNSRGALVDEAALAEALNTGKLAGAGIDAVRDEPIKPDNPLLSAKNCFITPHISWASLECRKRLIGTAIENFNCWSDGHPQNIFN